MNKFLALRHRTNELIKAGRLMAGGHPVQLGPGGKILEVAGEWMYSAGQLDKVFAELRSSLEEIRGGVKK